MIAASVNPNFEPEATIGATEILDINANQKHSCFLEF
jgi:hypothetical protein